MAIVPQLALPIVRASAGVYERSIERCRRGGWPMPEDSADGVGNAHGLERWHRRLLRRCGICQPSLEQVICVSRDLCLDASSWDRAKDGV